MRKSSHITLPPISGKSQDRSKSASKFFSLTEIFENEDNQSNTISKSKVEETFETYETDSVISSSLKTEYDEDPSSLGSVRRPRGPTVKERYFGFQARNKFFERLRFIEKQRFINNFAQQQSTDELMFDNEDPEVRDFPFLDLEAQSTQDDLSSQVSSLSSPTKLSVSKYASEFPAPEVKCALPLSPRSSFISACLREKQNPRANLIIRKRLGKSIDLQHMGVGDKLGGLFAECLKDLPFVETLNMDNNNLTDHSLEAIIQSLKHITTLKTLNLSRNKMDENSARALGEYVDSKTCPLQTLVLQKSDIDDFEGEKFVRSLAYNRSITSLDLSENKIGLGEALRAVNPELSFFSDSLAEILEDPTCKLKTLILTWNAIKLMSGVRICRSIAFNTSLTYLDLSYNSLGQEGGEALGDALIDNNTLTTINLTSNNLKSSPCFVISVGIIENRGLKRLVIDSNPIGQSGAQSLMMVPISTGGRVDISAEHCNMTLKDEKSWFSHATSLGKHTLTLSKPYDRAVAFSLLDLASNHSSYVINSCVYVTPSGKSETLKLSQRVIINDPRDLNKETQQTLTNLERLRGAASDIPAAKKIFEEIDQDGSGVIDRDELRELLRMMGMDHSEDSVDDILGYYDVDDSGELGYDEFLLFLKAQYKEATKSIAEIMENRVMVNGESYTRYIPPRTGTLKVDILDGYTKKASYAVVRGGNGAGTGGGGAGAGGGVGSGASSKSSKGSDSNVFMASIYNSKLRLNEALSLFNVMYSERGQRLVTLSKLLVRLETPWESRKMINKITLGDSVQISILRSIMGPIIRPILGFFSGYYILDLSKELDRDCLTRLLEHSEIQNMARKRQSPLEIGGLCIGDTSQDNNWTCFRNEIFNGEPFKITSASFQPIPVVGKLSFDFISIDRPNPSSDEIPLLTDKRLVKILTNFSMITDMQIGQAFYQLFEWTKALKKINNYPTSKRRLVRNKPPPPALAEFTKEKMFEIAKHCDLFYSSLAQRPQLHEEGSSKELIKIDLTTSRPSTSNSTSSLHGISKKALTSLQKPNTSDKNGGSRKTSQQSLTTASTAFISNRKKSYFSAAMSLEKDSLQQQQHQQLQKQTELLDELTANSQHSQTYATKREQNIAEELRKYRLLLDSPYITDEAKSVRLLEGFESVLGSRFIFCRHIAFIIHYFKWGSKGRTELFGSYYVELIVSLFSRIVDLHNFDLILSMLSVRDIACLYCRIGWLNIFNPLKPSGFWELNFARHEERQVAKMFVSLELMEPGDNWFDKHFTWSKDLPEVPGWDLTVTYTTDATCTTKGIISFQYSSGGDSERHPEFNPNWVFRQALMSMVLADEDLHAFDPPLPEGAAADQEMSEDESEDDEGSDVDEEGSQAADNESEDSESIRNEHDDDDPSADLGVNHEEREYYGKILEGLADLTVHHPSDLFPFPHSSGSNHDEFPSVALVSEEEVIERDQRKGSIGGQGQGSGSGLQSSLSTSVSLSSLTISKLTDLKEGDEDEKVEEGEEVVEDSIKKEETQAEVDGNEKGRVAASRTRKRGRLLKYEGPHKGKSFDFFQGPSSSAGSVAVSSSSSTSKTSPPPSNLTEKTAHATAIVRGPSLIREGETYLKANPSLWKTLLLQSGVRASAQQLKDMGTKPIKKIGESSKPVTTPASNMNQTNSSSSSQPTTSSSVSPRKKTAKK